MGSLVRLAAVADRQIRTRAFTLIELLVVVGITATLTAVAYSSMTKLQTSTDSKTSVDRIVATLRAQRMYAMLGNSILRIQAMPQGIHFDQGKNTYTQFSCPQTTNCAFDPNNSSNVQQGLEETLSFSEVNLENDQIVFIPLSGNVLDYTPEKNSITISSRAETGSTTIQTTSMGTVNVMR